VRQRKKARKICPDRAPQINVGTRPGDWQPTPNPVPFDPPAAADHLQAVLPGWDK